MTLFIVLPIFNEALNLELLVGSIADTCSANAWTYRIIAIDDGSMDGTATLLERLAVSFPITVIPHRRNRGLGETIRDGFEVAADLATPEDVIIRMDADRTHDPKYISALVHAITEGADLAVASRFQAGGGAKGLANDRKWISRLANIAFRLFFPLGGIREYTCGYRAYRAMLIQRALQVYGGSFIQLRGLGFCCTVEKLLKLSLIGARIVEVPFILRYDLKQGSSKMIFNVTSFGYAVMVILYHWPRRGWKSAACRRASRAAKL